MTKQLLRVGVLVAAMLGVATTGCSGEPGDPSEETAVGSVELPLTAQSGDVLYRLAAAKFTIKGGTLTKPRTITPAPNTPVHQETLPLGNYSIFLEAGWRLEQKSPASKEWVEVPANLVVTNPQKFDVKQALIANVVFSFGTAAGSVDFRQGRANVRIAVQDCSSFNSYTAALGTLTVDCLGTIDTNSYLIDQEGYLQKNFKECPLDPTRLKPITDLLGVQYKRAGLPDSVNNQLANAKQCISNRWSAWKAALDESGVVQQCPTWKKEREIGTPTEADYDRYAKALPPLPFAENGGDRPSVIQQMKVNALYTVTFEANQPSQQCESAGNCARLCAGGFPGFVIRQEASNAVLTDPPPWETDTVYARGNPFQRPGFYHPMSLYGAPPGDLLGAHARALSPAPGELCSFFSEGFHQQTTLKENCQVMNTGEISCVSACIP